MTDIAQRLKAKRFFKGDILKDFNLDPTYVWFICSGSVGVFEKKVIDKKYDEHGIEIEEEEDEDVPLAIRRQNHIMVNNYHAGRSFGDPELNYCTPISS